MIAALTCWTDIAIYHGLIYYANAPVIRFIIGVKPGIQGNPILSVSKIYSSHYHLR
jgi:hypothetical protein